MRPQEVGDGMDVIALCAGSVQEKELEIESVTAGMCVYEWFDENTWETQYYGYWFDRNKIEWVQDICNKIWASVQLHEEKFIRIEASHNLDNQTEVHVLSYLFWLALIYGTFDGWEWLKHVKIHLPLEWTIAKYEEKIWAMIEWLKNEKLYITHNHQDQKNGQLLQLNIDDKQILDIWSGWLWWGKYDVSKYRNKIDELLGHDNFTKDKVLKFLHK